MKMRRLAAQLFWNMVRFSGLPRLARHWVHGRRVGILLYHDPDPALFARHMAYVAARYQFISLAQLVDAIAQRDWSRIPPKALVITLDDGHLGNYALLEIFKQHQIRPTIFVCSALVGTQRHFWWKNGYPNPATLKTVPRAEMLQRLATTVGYTPDRDYPDRQALSLAEIQAMRPWVDFQAHTVHHPVLPYCEDADSQAEIQHSKIQLEQLLGSPVEHFAYPNGDYGARELHYLRLAGFRSARTVKFGWNDLDTPLYLLKILDIQEEASIAKLSAQITGLYHWMMTLKEKLLP